MAKVRKNIVLNAAPEDVWALIGDFNALPEWHPTPKGSRSETRDGKTFRILTLPDGTKLTEMLESHDDKKMKYGYTITEGPLPVDDYHAKIKLDAKDGGCEVKWKGRFKPKGVSEEEAVKVIAGIYEAGLEALKKKFG